MENLSVPNGPNGLAQHALPLACRLFHMLHCHLHRGRSVLQEKSGNPSPSQNEIQCLSAKSWVFFQYSKGTPHKAGFPANLVR
jgi:hypothetical protein